MVSVEGRALLTVLVIALAAPGVSGAQASPAVPLDDIAYSYIDALRARGQLRSLSALERPYTADELRAALAEDSAAELGRVVSSWRSALVSAIAKYDPHADRCTVTCEPGADEGLAVRASAGVFASARTSGVRELMVADDIEGVYPGAVGRFAARGGPFVAVSRLLVDNRLKDDPEFVGKKNRMIAARVEDAYLGVRFPFVEITGGRVARNHGPAAVHGLMIGNYAYTYDHLFARFGTRRFHLVSMVTSLDPMRLGPGDSVANRYLAMHRLSGRWGGLEIAVAEAMVFGGVGRRFDPGHLNPLNIFQLTQYNERGEGNVAFSVEAAWRSARFGTFAGQVLFDDFQIDDCTPACEEPSSYGVTLSAEGLPLIGAQRWFGSYARVANLTYRTPARFEAWTSFGVGLGHGRSDYDEVRLGLDLALLPGLTLRPYGAYRRQGEGDYRLPFPAPAEYPTTPGIHSGVVEKTTRVGAAFGWTALRVVEVRADLGWNHSADADHVTGARSGRFEGWIRVAVESPWTVEGRARVE